MSAETGASTPSGTDVPMWFDSHSHLQQEYLAGDEALAGALERARAAGVGWAVCVGTGLASSLEAIEIAANAVAPPSLYATVGLHPHDASAGTRRIAELAESSAGERGPKGPGSVVGIGECGLDYYYEHSPRDDQRAAFLEQAQLARRLDLTLVVHTRDAWEDTYAILGEVPGGRTIIHCFTGGPREAERCLELGAYLSFSGIATFKNADAIRDAALACPADRLLVETDSPFLAPVPHRGKANEPAFVAVVGEALAQLRAVGPAELAATTAANAATVFALAS
ncbi:MAG: putative deoxyribonuclease [Acidimicrobiaceae bacterium]|nr:putative deoxyribonuclease [Acidimicrobiaceae bacterium]